MTAKSDLVHEAIVEAIRKRAEAKTLEEAAAVLKAEANKTLLELRESGAIAEKKVSAAGVGHVTFVARTTRTLDKDAFKTGLVAAGVSVSVIADAEEAATTVKESMSVQFTPEREGADEA